MSISQWLCEYNFRQQQQYWEQRSVIHLFIYYLVCEAIGTAAPPGLLCQPRVIVKMTVEKQMECRLAGETEVLRENLTQRHFCPSQNPTWPDPGLNPGRRGGNPATNRLSYGAAERYTCCYQEWNRDISLHAVTSVILSSEVRTVPTLVFFMVED
jgi:hypothetical protein